MRISCFNAFHAFPFSIFKVLVSTQGNELLISSQSFLDPKDHWGVQLKLPFCKPEIPGLAGFKHFKMWIFPTAVTSTRSPSAT